MLENIAVILATIVGILPSLFCIAFIFYKIKLNGYIKAILFVQTSTNLLSQTLILIASILIGSTEPSMGNCCFLAYPVLIVSGTMKLPSMISMLRIYMAHLSAKAKIAKPIILGNFVFIGLFFNISFDAALESYRNFMNYDSFASTCAKIKLQPSNMIVPLLRSSAFFLFITLGLYCDIRLWKFVKNRQAIHPAQLVPWKSSHENQQQDLQIPIRATIFSGFSTVLGVVIVWMILVMYSTHLGETQLWIYITVMLLSSSLSQIVLVLGTMKQQNVVASISTANQPPVGLQFHENNQPTQVSEECETRF